MSEVQSHGLLFENVVIEAITGLSKAEYQRLLPNSYTNSMDIARGYLSEVDRSIKATSGSGVGCGDILRFLRHCRDDDFVMVVGIWKQITPKLKLYHEIYEFQFSPKHYATLFADLTEETLTPFVEYVKAIPYGREGQLSNRKVWKERRSTIYETYGKGIVAIDAKIDSKTQRRVQCSVKINDLISSDIPFSKYTTDYKGISLPYEQESTPRTFSGA
jgi:hypothetical protein